MAAIYLPWGKGDPVPPRWEVVNPKELDRPKKMDPVKKWFLDVGDYRKAAWRNVREPDRRDKRLVKDIIRIDIEKLISSVTTFRPNASRIDKLW